MFRHGAPLVVERCEGVRVKLLCNHAFGHQVWEMVVSGQGGTPGVIELREIPPPDAPIPDTQQDFAAFRDELDARPTRPPDTPVAFRKWQKVHRAKLWSWLMPRGLKRARARRAEWAPIKECDGFTISRLTYRSRPGREVKALVSLPEPRPDSAVPLLLALHGHEATWGEADIGAFEPGHNDDFCHYFASRGFAVLQPPTLDHVRQGKTWTLFGEWLWDAMTGRDVVSRCGDIDMSRVGVVGLSTGGFLTMLVTALDERIRAAVTAGSFTTRNHLLGRYRIPPHCDCGSREYLFRHIDFCDIVALASPRPFQIQHGRQDCPFCPGADPSGLNLEWNTGAMPTNEFEAAVSEVRRVYRMAGVPERVAVRIHEGGHAVDNQAAYRWISKGLHGR